MIIRKPYAFLIKYFKVIHLILSAFFAIVIYKTIQIFTFYNAYVKNGYYTYYESLNKQFLGTLFYLFILFILIFIIILYFLMRWKNKKRNYYLISIIFYVVLLGVIIYTSNVFNNMATSTLDVRTIRVMRDIWLMVLMPQFIIIIISIVRGLGFNIKSFDFRKDLESLDISDKDNEEIEVTTGNNSYKYKRYFRKYLREFKYYFAENKKMLILIFSIVFIVIAIILSITFINRNKRYVSVKSFYDDGFNITINDIFVTNTDYNGNVINNEKKFLIIDFTVLNRNSKSSSINKSNFIVRLNNNSFQSLTYSKYFVDLGTLYVNQSLSSNVENSYILVYELNRNIDIDKLDIMYMYDIDDKNNVYYYVFDDEVNVVESTIIKHDYVYGDDIMINDNVFSINEFEIAKSFTKKYKVTINDKEYSNTQIIKPDINYIDDYDVLRININFDCTEKEIKEILTSYGFINYEKDGVEKTINASIINLINNDLYVYIPSNIDSAQLFFEIRQNWYIIDLI